MSIFDLIGDVVTLPIDMAEDAVAVVTGEEADNTTTTLEDIGEEIEDFFGF